MDSINQTFSTIFLLIFFALTGKTLSVSDYAEILPATGFDFPVGAPDAQGYYKARGFWPNGHVGEDWNGKGGGNSDLGDPVYAIGQGIVVQSRDVRRGWGNVIIIRHAFIDKNGAAKLLDSLYAHLDSRNVVLNQIVKRGQKIGTIGNNRGMYLAHLHFETRKNLAIGMHRSSFSKTYSNYYSPTSFIRSHRQCPDSRKAFKVPINTFAPYPGAYPKGKKKPKSTIIAKAKESTIINPIKKVLINPLQKKSPETVILKKKPTPKSEPKTKPTIAKKNIQTRPSKLDPPKKQLGLLARLRARYPSTKSGTGRLKRNRFSPRKKR
ncbi:M23 family metallopeptidase [Verrucomicrobia bacterium]|nr:M23 family metallopeptidase [Verrucomicrobiota bacterium]